jgi:hypothetical protein
MKMQKIYRYYKIIIQVDKTGGFFNYLTEKCLFSLYRKNLKNLYAKNSTVTPVWAGVFIPQ